MKTRTLEFITIFVAGALFVCGLAFQFQDKKVKVSPAPPKVQLSVKVDSISIDSLLPDTTLAVKQEVIQLKQMLISNNEKDKLGEKSDRKIISELKKQGNKIDNLVKNSPYVDTLPGPEFTSKPIPFPDTIHIITEQRQSFWESLFKRKRP